MGLEFIKKFFDEQGNCPTLGDPYRDNPKSEAAQYLFDDDGNLEQEAIDALHSIIKERHVATMCDAVRLLVADQFANNTKGCYSTITLFR